MTTSTLRTRIAVLFTMLCGMLQAQDLSIVPLPKEMTRGNGTFTFRDKCFVKLPKGCSKDVKNVYRQFEEQLEHTTPIDLTTTRRASKAQMVWTMDATLPAEGYALTVDAQGIAIRAAQPAGFYYALQTLKQLMPRNVMAGVASEEMESLTIPTVQIADEPRFGWRGFMLDEGRHFYGKEAIMKLLDVMSAYKMNRFHWHLTEDQGWRIEIKKYPKLTEVGAWRESLKLAYGNTKTDGIHYGGFYTQDDIREVVAYAKERFIEIVPEIDIPGHSQAAVASYPEFLSCDPENKHEVWLGQGISADVINVANPQAVQFAKDVIDELLPLFPFGYIHLGGDECPTYKWEHNEACQQLLKEIGSTNYRDLQIHFYHQLQQYIASKPADEQCRLIFWNEVLHGNTEILGDDITIMAWVGADQAAKVAAQRGMTTILSPQIPYYINRRQSPLPTEPMSQGNGSETVEAVYNYRPMHNVQEASLQEKYLGVQANFWTEWVETPSIVEYLMFPRLAAVAEAGWTPQAKRNYNDFEQRIQADAAYYRLRGVNYGKHIFKADK